MSWHGRWNKKDPDPFAKPAEIGDRFGIFKVVNTSVSPHPHYGIRVLVECVHCGHERTSVLAEIRHRNPLSHRGCAGSRGRDANEKRAMTTTVRPSPAPLVIPSVSREYLVPEDRAVAMIERCAVEIQEAQTIPEVRRVITQAEAIQVFLRQVNASKEMKRAALALLVEAEQQLGRISRELPHAVRPRPSGSDMSRVEAHVIKHPGSSVGDVAVAFGFTHRRASDLLYRCVARHQLVRAGEYGAPTFSPGPRGRQNLTRGKNEVLRENGIHPARARFAEKLADVPEAVMQQAIDTVKQKSVISVQASLGITRGFDGRGRTREYAEANKQVQALSDLVREGLDLLDQNIKTGEVPRIATVDDARRRLARLTSRDTRDE